MYLILEAARNFLLSMIPENDDCLISGTCHVLSTSEMKLFIQFYINLNNITWFMSLAWKVIFHFIPWTCFFLHLHGKGDARVPLGKRLVPF